MTAHAAPVRQATARGATPRGTAPRDVLQRKCTCGTHTGGGTCAACAAETEREEPLQRHAPLGHAMAPPAGLTPAVRGVLASPGQPLPASVRTRMEPLFGADFSRVRVHTDGAAGASVRQLGARAYTVGTHVAFESGRYAPGTPLGDALLAHELAHVVQQSRGSQTPAPAAAGRGGEALEQDADRSAAGVMATLWAGGREWVRELRREGAPRLRSGLRLSLASCSGCGDCSGGKSAEDATSQTAPEGGGPDDAGATQPADAATPLPAAATTKCDGSESPDKIIVDHRADKSELKSPLEDVTFTASFACLPRDDAFSSFVAPGGQTFGRSLQSAKGRPRLVRTWNSTKQYVLAKQTIGTFEVEDGDYRHRIEPFKYAIKGGKDKLTAGGGLHDSPPVKVRARELFMPSATSNADTLAEIVESEMGVGNDTEKRAVAWAVRNQMLRSGKDAAGAAAQFADATGTTPKAATKTLAEDVLKKKMADDTTSGAIKWFSPRSMPKKGESCKGKDCGGGLQTFTDDSGKSQDVYTPSWSSVMTHVPIAGVRDWYLRVYKL